MRPLLLCFAALSLASCAQTADPKVLRVKLRDYLTERVRKHEWKDIRTDEDSRARKPTKYADATEGLLFTIRHSAKAEGTPVMMSTWAFESRGAREASRKGPFQAILDDVQKSEALGRAFNADEGDLHLIFFFESPSHSMGNAFQMLERELSGGLAEVAK